MNLDMTIFHQAFFEEAGDLLNEFESLLLRLEGGGESDSDLLNTIFRCAHSIKGGSATFGFADIAHFTHGLETLLDRVRNGEISITPSLISLLLASLDQMKALLAVARGFEASAPDSTPLIARIEAAIEGREESPENRASEEHSAEDKDEDAAWGLFAEDSNEDPLASNPILNAQPSLWHLRFAPGLDVLRHGSDPKSLLAQLARVVKVETVVCDTSFLPPLDTLDAEACYLAWDVRFHFDGDKTEIEDIFEFVAEESELILTQPGAEDAVFAGGEQELVSANGLCIVSNADDGEHRANAGGHNPAGADADAVRASSENEGAGSGLAVEAKAEAVSAPKSLADAGGKQKPGAAASARAPETPTLRVATDKVDKLINLVGELVINQSMLNEVISDFSMAKLPRLIEAVGEMERASRELQERVMAIRMLPIKHAFGRFPRLVHDLAQLCGKKIELKMTGEETELDKTVIEAIADPLTHLVRNSIDHGLEAPEARRAAGKSETGTVTLNAFHEGGSIVIEVEDDGRGLNRDGIAKKAVERGLLSEGDMPSDDTLYNLIFHPGFSTAAQVTDLSGRGVGMDIVKSSVQGLGGSITLTTTPGQGTRFRIRLPLTMAILEGLSLSVGEEVYILPLTSIVESIRPKPGDVRIIAGCSEVVLVRGEVLPILRLYSIFGASPQITDPTRGLLVIVENDRRKVALLVDELIGQSQVVIKSLESNYRKVYGIAGATILGDGRVALILDIPGLIGGETRAQAALAA